MFDCMLYESCVITIGEVLPEIIIISYELHHNMLFLSLQEDRNWLALTSVFYHIIEDKQK